MGRSKDNLTNNSKLNQKICEQESQIEVQEKQIHQMQDKFKKMQKEMQAKMQEMQERLAGIEVTGTSGAGMVTVILNGKAETVELQPQSAFLRRIQHRIAERAELRSPSQGREPHRRVTIAKTQGRRAGSGGDAQPHPRHRAGDRRGGGGHLDPRRGSAKTKLCAAGSSLRLASGLRKPAPRPRLPATPSRFAFLRRFTVHRASALTQS